MPKTRLNKTEVLKHDGEFTLVGDNDEVRIDPEHIIDRGFMGSLQQAEAYLNDIGIGDNDGPYSIYEMFEEKGEQFLDLIHTMMPGVKCVIPAKFCTCF